MKLLLDQGLPRSAVAGLRQSGHDVDHVADCGLARATDQEILDEADRRGAVVVTLDADFHELLAWSGATRPSVLRLRVEGLNAERLVALLAAVLAAAASDLERGAVATSDGVRVRVRLLPLDS